MYSIWQQISILAKSTRSSNEWYKQLFWKGKCYKTGQCWWSFGVCIFSTYMFSISPKLLRNISLYTLSLFSVNQTAWQILYFILNVCSETFPSGCLTLDCALGGGLPKGRIVEVLPLYILFISFCDHITY